MISTPRDASVSSASAAVSTPNPSRPPVDSTASPSPSLASAADDSANQQTPTTTSSSARRMSEVLSSPTVPLAGSHVGWVRQQETVESSKVAGTHRIAIRETFHPLRKIVSEGTGNDAPVSKDPDRSLLPSALADAPRLDHIPMVRPSFSDHEIAIAEPWAAVRHHRHGDGTVDVTWDTKVDHTSSRGRSTRVEESIEANLTNAEPAAHVRSRKSSHYLGLFKENTTSPERKRREDRGRGLECEETPEEPEDERREEEESESQHTPRPAHATLHLPAGKESAKHHPPPSSELSKPLLGDSQSSSSLTQETSELDNTRHADTADLPGRPRSLPRSLLEEIRNFHLTSGGARGGSFSQSIPTQYAERKNFDEKSRDYGSQSPDLDDFRSRRERQQEEDEDEQISSALYFPHEPTATEDVYHHEKKLGGSEPEIGGHVDISLRSRHDRSILHGDFQSTSDAEDKSLATISEYSHESTSESETVSADESAVSTREEESSLTDDAELTPTATPTQGQRYARPRRKHAQTRPIGAVELKPYRHQVGGHTTVFRFSRRAVCKQLNNRENEFYERIEKRHPEMLMFLPRFVSPFSSRMSSQSSGSFSSVFFFALCLTMYLQVYWCVERNLFKEAKAVQGQTR